jgi:imidazolonepropionase-like amidohydrolase
VGISSGRITSIRPVTPRREDAVGAVLDVSDMYLCPALVDMHVHLCHEARAHCGVGFHHGETDETARLRAVQNLAEALLHGVSLVRDLGGRPGPLTDISRQVSDGDIVLPEIETAGLPFCIESGHGHEFGRTLGPGEDVFRVMEQQARAGHSWVKVMNGPEIWDETALSILCHAAHEHDLKVAVHAFTDPGVWGAVKGTADTVEHCLASSETVAAAAADSGTTFVPTAFAARTSLAPSFASTMPPHELAYLEEWLAYLESSVEPHLAAKLPALIGTDAGCAPCQAEDVIDELLQLEQWGFATRDVIAWATRDGATALGRSADFGEVAVGRYASLLVTARDPLDTVANLRDPALILHKGVTVRDRLGARLA